MTADGLENRLRELRARHGLTQAQLAEKVGVTRKTINTSTHTNCLAHKCMCFCHHSTLLIMLPCFVA